MSVVQMQDSDFSWVMRRELFVRSSIAQMDLEKTVGYFHISMASLILLEQAVEKLLGNFIRGHNGLA